MLQRAASSANSLWWASNIRTKESKWLDIDLQEMDERVKSMLKIVEGDGDYSFSKKAEMYFKKRPELVHYIEETFKAYRALADKFDHVSTELNKANHTIAIACPDQIPFDIKDDEDYNSPKAIVSNESPKVRQADIPQNNLKKSRLTKPVSQNNAGKIQEEINKLQKVILVLETEKEFIKSSYESGISRYLDIKKQIAEIQEEVFLTQDESNAIVTIDEDEARTLMAATAIKSCEDSVMKLQEQQKQSMEEARIEFERIKIAKVKIKSDSSQSEEITNIPIAKVSLDAESLCERIEIPSHTSMAELTEKINELVSKVIDLEMTASSQTAQIKSMRSEADIIQMHLQSSEKEKKNCIDDSNKLIDKAKVCESSTVAHHSVDDVPVVPEEVTSLYNTEATRVCEEEVKEVKEMVAIENNIVEEPQGVKEVDLVLQDQKIITHSKAELEFSSSESNPKLDDRKNSLNRLQTLANGFEGKENIILTEYTSIIQDYNDTKKRLSEIEKKNQECFLEMEARISELKNANAMKDEEINSLRQNLKSLHPNSNDHSEIQLVEPEMSENSSLEALIEGGDNDIKLPATEIEEKFRRGIDKVLEENLEFWLRFSASFHNTQKFETTFEELQSEIKKLGNSLPIEKKLIELQTAIKVYLEENMLLQGEMETKISSVNSIQDEISETLQTSLEADVVKFAPCQATKFQGELRNMQLENNNVSKELKAGTSRINDLKYEDEKTHLNLKEKSEVEESASKNQERLSNCSPKSQVPLRVFLVDAKNKKQRSIFACAGNLHHL